MKCIKLKSIFCGLAMVSALMSVKTDAGTLGALTYEIKDNQVTITDCDRAAEGELIIPDVIQGSPVTSIGIDAFGFCGGLTSIIIPDSVTSIGHSAFIDCKILTSITIPDGVTSIGSGSFSNCRSLTSISIPEGVTSIGMSAFSHCESLTSIIIPDSVTSIGEGAFNFCRVITSVIIPDNVTSIGPSAFDECSSLASITLGNSVTSIGSYAFYDCFRLASITIPDGVTSIGDSAFKYCRSLTSITIPEAFHRQSEAMRLGLQRLWPDGFFLPDNSQKPPLGNPGQASANAILANGFVIGTEIAQEGAGYLEVPAVTISGGGGSGAEAVAVLTSGRVTSIEIINAGRGYTSAPTITIEPPPITSTQVSLRMVPAITVTGIIGQTETIEVSDNADGPWTEWRTVVIGEDGTTEVDLDAGAEKRFYRIRN